MRPLQGLRFVLYLLWEVFSEYFETFGITDIMCQKLTNCHVARSESAEWRFVGCLVDSVCVCVCDGDSRLLLLLLLLLSSSSSSSSCGGV